MSSIRFEEVSCCPICKSSSTELKFISPDFLHGVPGEFRYVLCTECRTVYQNPRVVSEDLGLCYPRDYFTHSIPEPALTVAPPLPDSLRDRIRRTIRHSSDGASAQGLSTPMRMIGGVLSVAPSLRQRARFGLPDALAKSGEGEEKCLEVGSGQGMTLRCLKWLGWEAVGLDVDSAAAANARRLSGCEVKVGTLMNIELPAASFQLIYMSHVIEHLPDLEESLKRCWQLLVPNGRLVLNYPNPDSLTASYYQKYSCNWDPPRHLVIPPCKALVGLLQHIGFSNVVSSTSARRAAHYRSIVRLYRQNHQDERRITLGDRLFGLWESLCVFASASVGEDVTVIAYKS